VIEFAGILEGTARVSVFELPEWICRMAGAYCHGWEVTKGKDTLTYHLNKFEQCFENSQRTECKQAGRTS